MMMTPLRASKPSISASSWLSVCSRSSWLPIGRLDADLAERVELVDEDDARAPWPRPGRTDRGRGPRRRRRTSRRTPSRSGEKKGTFASPATARASSVLPVPGGPTSSTPLGMRPPMLRVLLRASSGTRRSRAARPPPRPRRRRRANLHLHVVVGVDLGAAARERHHAAFGAAHAAEEEAPERRPGRSAG